MTFHENKPNSISNEICIKKRRYMSFKMKMKEEGNDSARELTD